MDTMPPGESVESEPPSTRAVRARRRRWRRRIGVAVFVAVAVGVLAIAFLAISDSDDDSNRASTDGDRRASSTTTTLPSLPPAGPYQVTDGVNVRSGPGTNYSIVGTIEVGHEVMVICAIDGEAVNGPSGPTSKWVRITSQSVGGYVTGQYVDTGPAIDDRSVIPLCTAI